MNLKIIIVTLGVLCYSCKEPSPETTVAPLIKKQTNKRRKTENNIIKQSTNIVITTAELALLMGKFEPKKHPDFILISTKHADRPGLYLQRSAYDSYKLMHDAAKKDGVNLVIKSATRNFKYQKGIWERKWTGTTKVNGKNLAKTIIEPSQRAKEILKYSSMPGSSRHHWGTDIDLNSFDNRWFEKGQGKMLYNWLVKHAGAYGFCQVYTSKDLDNRSGYEEEKWHWSYLPLSKKLTALTSLHLKDDMFADFKGASTASELNIVSDYILGINEKCM